MNERDETNVTLAVRARVAVKGRIQIEGSSVDEDPCGQRCTIWAEPANADPKAGVGIGTIARVGSSLEFSLQGMSAAPYWLRVHVPGGMAVKSVRIGSREYRDTPVDLSDEMPLDDVTVTMARGGEVRGSVARAPTAAPNEAFAVVIFPVARAHWTDYGFTSPSIGGVVTDADGRFTFTGIPAGDYFVVALPPWRRHDWKDPSQLEALAGSTAAVRVSVAWGEAREVSLAPPRGR